MLRKLEKDLIMQVKRKNKIFLFFILIFRRKYMKKNINIEKSLEFSSMIGEISAISLEHNLKFISNDEISGDLIVSGRYKSTSASQIEEEFDERIPISISLLEKVDVTTSKIEISDFYYNIIDSSSLKCNIDLLIDALELIDDDRESLQDDERECDGDPVDLKEIEIPKIENTIITEKKVDEEIDINTERTDDDIENIEKSIVESSEINIVEEDIVSEEINNEETESLFFNFDSSKETYGTFIVYIVRQNETINSILEKYNTSLEEIEKYNDVKDISIGSKLIIPLLNEKD